MLWNELPDTFRQHLENPHAGGTFEEYSSVKHLRHGGDIAHRTRIYLDTKFWVRFRDVLQDRAKCTSDLNLVNLIIELCDAKVAVCPVSYSSLEELMHQQDPISRRATAQLMDRLSDGACLQPPHALFSIELDYWLHQVFFPHVPLHERVVLVWTKPFYFVGQPRLQCEILTADQDMAAEKSSFDAMWSASICQLSDLWRSHGASGRAECVEVAQKLTSGKFEHHDTTKSFNDLYADEVWGGLDAYKREIDPVFERLMRKTGYAEAPSAAEVSTGTYLLRKMIATAYQHGKLSTQLPQCHINASLHAALRMNDKRQYKPGDCEDFRHAGSALPYCDIFLTERSLRHLPCTSPLHLDADYNVTVLTDADKPSIR
jgi:hypothetical protein